MDISEESGAALARHHDIKNELMKLEEDPIANRDQIEALGKEFDALMKTDAFREGLARAGE